MVRQRRRTRRRKQARGKGHSLKAARVRYRKRLEQIHKVYGKQIHRELERKRAADFGISFKEYRKQIG